MTPAGALNSGRKKLEGITANNACGYKVWPVLEWKLLLASQRRSPPPLYNILSLRTLKYYKVPLWKQLKHR